VAFVQVDPEVKRQKFSTTLSIALKPKEKKPLRPMSKANANAVERAITDSCSHRCGVESVHQTRMQKHFFR
jgi:hypothetical protein